MGEMSITGINKDHAETLITLGKNLSGVVDEVIDKSNKVLALLNGKTKNKFTNGAEANIQEIARSCNEVMEATKGCIIDAMKSIRERDESLEGTDQDIIDEIAKIFAGIQAVSIQDAGIVAGGDPLTDVGLSNISNGLRGVVESFIDGLQGQQELFKECIDHGELYSDGLAPIWEEIYKPTTQALADAHTAFKKNAIEAVENTHQFRSNVSSKVSDSAAEKKRNINASIDASVEQTSNAIKNLL